MSAQPGRSRTTETPWAIIIVVLGASHHRTDTFISTAAVTHSSGDVFSVGSELIEYIEQRLEHILHQPVSWKYVYKTLRKHEDPTNELRRMFELHSEYLRLNMERQRDLITDVDISSRSFISSELSVIESQKQTVERLISMYTGAVFAQQGELASYKANAVAVFGVLVAIIAVILTDFRFESLLK